MKQTGRRPSAGKKRLDAQMTRKAKRNAFVLAVLIPFAAWMLVYMLIPLVSVIFYSFTNAKMAYDDFRFVGLYQFQKMFSNTTARISIVNSVKAAVIIMPISLAMSLLTAAGLNALSDRFRNLYTFVYFLPNIMSMTAVCLVWRWLYHNQYGIFNAILQFFGLPKQQFLQSSSQVMLCLCIRGDFVYCLGYHPRCGRHCRRPTAFGAGLPTPDPTAYQIEGSTNNENNFVSTDRNGFIFLAVLDWHSYNICSSMAIISAGSLEISSAER